MKVKSQESVLQPGSFVIGSRPLSIRVQKHEADVNRHATKTLARLADLGLL